MQVTDSPTFRPYSYQQDALRAVEARRRLGADRALLIMATGLGKTVTAAFELRDILKAQPDARVLVLCHQNEILKQNETTFRRVIGANLETGSYFGGARGGPAQMVFASFQSMASNVDAFEPTEFDYVVVDEVHHVEAPTFKAVFDHFKPKFALGMTATKDRGDGLRIEDTFGQPVYSLELPEAMAQRLLTEVDYRVITDEFVRTGRLKTGEFEVRLSQLNTSVFIPPRDQEIAAVIREKWQGLSDPHTIVFAESTQHADTLASLLGGVTYHSAMPKRAQEIALEGFRSRQVNTIVTVNKFNEGVDIPEANCLVFARVTQSRTIFYQQLGRGLRLHSDKSHVLVLDFAANAQRLHLVRELRDRVGKGSEVQDVDVIERPGVEFTFDESAVKIISLLDRQARLATAEGVLQAAVTHFGSRGDQPVLSIDVTRAHREGVLPPVATISALFAERGQRDGLGNFIVAVEHVLGVSHPGLPQTRDAVVAAAADIARQRGLLRPLNRFEVARLARDQRLPQPAVIDTMFATSESGEGWKNFQSAVVETLGLDAGAQQTLD